MALGGRRLMMVNNNQNLLAGRVVGGMLDRRRAGRGEHVGGCHNIVWGIEWSGKKINMKNTTALNGRRLIILHTTTNQKQAAATEGSMKGR